MSVRHAGYEGDGVESYEAYRTFPREVPLAELTDAVDELRRELFVHRPGMEVESSNRAWVRVPPSHVTSVEVVVRGRWVDREAREGSRCRCGERGEGSASCLIPDHRP